MMAAAITCICLILFFLGASVASYLMCVGERLAREEKVIRKDSCCPHCGHVLGWKDLIPVISYLVRKGRCRYCDGKIPRRHLLTEALMGTAFVLLYLEYAFTIRFFLGIWLFLFLFTAAVEDHEAMSVHNRLLLIPAAGLLLSVFFLAPGEQKGTWIYLAICAGLFLLCVLAVSLIEKKTGKDLAGGADIKMLWLCIAFLGPFGSVRMLGALILAMIVKILLSIRKESVSLSQKRAMVPYIASAAAIAYLTPFLHWA